MKDCLPSSHLPFILLTPPGHTLWSVPLSLSGLGELTSVTTTQFTLVQVPRLTTSPPEGMTQGKAVAMSWTSGSVLLDTQERNVGPKEMGSSVCGG